MVDPALATTREGRKVPTWNNRKDPFLETMTAAAFRQTACCAAICMSPRRLEHQTVGGKWYRPSPNARYLFGRGEYEHWRDHSDEADKAAVIQ